MLIKVSTKTEFFFDVPLSISTASGSTPSRGIYTLVVLTNSQKVWLNHKGEEVLNPKWIVYLCEAREFILNEAKGTA